MFQDIATTGGAFGPRFIFAPGRCLSEPAPIPAAPFCEMRLPGDRAAGRLYPERGCTGSHRGNRIVTGSQFLAHWYFQVPNFILAALMYTLIGRALLGLIVGPESGNYIWRFFCRITDPVVAAVAVATPRAVAPVVVWLFGVVWLFWLRVGFLILFTMYGLVPKSG